MFTLSQKLVLSCALVVDLADYLRTTQRQFVLELRVVCAVLVVYGDVLQALLEIPLRVQVLRLVDKFVSESEYPRPALDGVTLVIGGDVVFQFMLHVGKTVQYLLQLSLLFVPLCPYPVDDKRDDSEEPSDNRRHDPRRL